MVLAQRWTINQQNRIEKPEISVYIVNWSLTKSLRIYKLEIHIQKDNFGPFLYTIQKKNHLKMD